MLKVNDNVITTVEDIKFGDKKGIIKDITNSEESGILFWVELEDFEHGELPFKESQIKASN